ncbi:hypothetical protein HDU79_011599 [Rhizoclosmatium sp. JEL0117]|nr:hypothetical protein HDU79_011599 [Rhizoclosmatium sp. JEL0117]
MNSKRIASTLLPLLLPVQRKSEGRHTTSNLRSLSLGPDQTQCHVFCIQTRLCGRAAFECDVLFDASDSGAGPDIIPLGGLVGLKLKDVSPLATWDSKDDLALLKVMDCLTAFYLNRELLRIQATGVESVVFDVSTLDHYQNLEYVLVEESGENEVHIRFDTQYQHPPGDSADMSLDPIAATVHLTYTLSPVSPVVSKITPRVDFSHPTLSTSFTLPPFPPTTVAIDFLSDLEIAVKQHLVSARELVGKKKRLCEAVVAAFPTQVLEWDDTGFSKASFYFEERSATSKKEARGVVVLFEFYDAKSPRMAFVSPILSRSGREDEYMPFTKVVPVSITLNASVDENVKELQAILKVQIPAFITAAGNVPTAVPPKSFFSL